MNEYIAHKIDVEVSYILNLWERHRNGEKNIKFLLILYIREFELHHVSVEIANRVIRWIDGDFNV